MYIANCPTAVASQQQAVGNNHAGSEANLRTSLIVLRFIQVILISITFIITAVATSEYVKIYDKLSNTRWYFTKSSFNSLAILSITVLIFSILALVYVTIFLIHTMRPHTRRPPPVPACHFIPDTNYTSDMYSDIAQAVFWLVYVVTFAVIFGMVTEHWGKSPAQLTSAAVDAAVVFYVFLLIASTVAAAMSGRMRHQVRRLSVFETAAAEIV